jgi:hypothetical protein
MGVLATGCSSINFGWAPWRIDDREAVAPLVYGSFPDLARANGQVRFTSMSRHRQHDRLRPKSADTVAKVSKCLATNFSQKEQTSDNRRSMQPQTRYWIRL